MSDTTQLALSRSASIPEMASTNLVGFERLAVPFLTWLNTSTLPKNLIQIFVKHFSRRWVALIARHRWQLSNFDALRELDPPSSVILVSNHRSFFDMYVACAVLYQETRILDRLFFPVRKNFFYDHPLGFFVNLSVSGGAMWPPVFKDHRRGDLNPVGTGQMIHVLQSRGNAIGIHPEGTRSKGESPYDMLPARPGVGKLVRGAPDNALVIPFFIQGMTNDLRAEIKGLFFGGRPPIRIRWGDPIAAGDLRDFDEAQGIAEHLHGVIGALGEAERKQDLQNPDSVD